jgi:catechol 2,3-dioxygenase-like lactoylglutathione lyase family enzyme
VTIGIFASYARLSMLAVLMAGAGGAHAQPAGAPAPAPTGLVVGSGNFYSPIVANLDDAVAFYRDGVGFEVQGEATNADANPQLRAMFGLPDARLRQKIGRVPGIPGGVEIVEISGAGGRQVERRMQDPGTVMLIVSVRDIEAPLARLKQMGAPVVTTGGAPVMLSGGQLLAVVVKDPAGHFVELLQPSRPPATASASNILAVTVRHTVANLEDAVKLYHGALGLQGSDELPTYVAEPTVLDLLGLRHGMQYRYTRLNVPTSGLGIELMEFKNGRRSRERANVADPGSTRMQLRVADIDAAGAALTSAGGTFVSTGGGPLDLPAGATTLRVGMVRDPDDLFVVLIQAPR